MKVLRGLCLIVVMSVAAVSFAGDIQVSCETGLRVYLDGEFMGTSSAREDGLFLMNVATGAHTIRLEKDGFLPQDFSVKVLRLPIEVTAEQFSPAPTLPSEQIETVSVELKQPVGILVVASAPQNCVVEVDGKSEEKTTPQLAIGGLAAGDHAISFSKEGYETISGEVTIRPGMEVSVRGNLLTGKVEVIHEGVGALRVISKPNKCTVHILGMRKDKIYQNLNLTHLPAGEHRMVVSIAGRELATKVLIMDRHRTIVEVSFMKGDEPFLFSYVPQ